ncbi:polysaccharide deacetylase family protein [Natrononativus amylolyticus]|uniref:polysaccharide deacetylase family protein n=1 Tax=Natrononativus amylolyticus TaxID=2963434 RepID=UPI0020CEDA63|nr:polysaccharide deacetylase family protein [Natrononativus amylolyticus]
MKRRAYLSAALAMGLAGCTETGALERTDDDPPASDDRPTRDDERATDEGSGDDPDEGDETDPDESPNPSASLEVLDDFEDLSLWTTLEGTLSADTDRYASGTQSARLEATVADSSVVIAREFDAPRDFSTAVPGLALQSGRMVSPTIQLFDDAGDRIDYRRAVKGGLPTMRFNFGVSNVVGSPDLSAITHLRIVAWAGEHTRRFWCDELHLTPRPERGKVMIQFDDGYETDYTEAFPILERYGYPAVTFVNPGRVGASSVGGRPVLDLAQIEELADAGWTISSHTENHPALSELDAAEQEAEIRDAKEWLVDHGFEDGAQYFAYPFGEYDATTIELVEKYHALGFAGGPPAQGYAVNPQLCSRIGDPDFERAREAFDWAASMNGISSVFYHALDDEDDLADFESTIEYLHELESAGDVDVILPRDVEETYSV